MVKAGGEASAEATGEGRTEGWLIADGDGKAEGTLAALSKYSQNLPSFTCHSFHCSFDAKRLYRILLRNSTSIT